MASISLRSSSFPWLHPLKVWSLRQTRDASTSCSSPWDGAPCADPPLQGPPDPSPEFRSPRRWRRTGGRERPSILAQPGGFGLADEGEAGCHAEERELVLEVLGHEGAAVIVAQADAVVGGRIRRPSQTTIGSAAITAGLRPQPEPLRWLFTEALEYGMAQDLDVAGR